MLISSCNKDHSDYLRTVILPDTNRFFAFIQHVKHNTYYVIVAALI